MKKNENFITGTLATQHGTGLTYNQMVNSITAADKPSYERMLDLSWLEACSGDYKISANPDDYVFGIIRALVIDLPNRNGHCFEMDEMTKFNTSMGKQVYRTFEGKPLLINHKYVLEEAAGAIVAARMIQEGPYVPIELVVAADRIKYPKVAASISKGQASFSMGANCSHFDCSICGASFSLSDPDHHCTPANMLKVDEKGRLAYARVRNPVFIEESILIDQNPADPRALHSEMSII